MCCQLGEYTQLDPTSNYHLLPEPEEHWSMNLLLILTPPSLWVLLHWMRMQCYLMLFDFLCSHLLFWFYSHHLLLFYSHYYLFKIYFHGCSQFFLDLNTINTIWWQLNYFWNFHPKPWGFGFRIPIWRADSSKGVETQPPTCFPDPLQVALRTWRPVLFEWSCIQWGRSEKMWYFPIGYVKCLNMQGGKGYCSLRVLYQHVPTC